MEIFTIEEEKILIDAVKGSACLYVQTQAEGDLKTMVDDVCALIGLQFAKRISNLQPSRSLDLVRALFHYCDHCLTKSLFVLD